MGMKEYIMRYENEVLQLLPDKIQPLIRCKDCRNAVVYDDNEIVCAHIDSNGNDKQTADWFCADGEAKI